MDNQTSKLLIRLRIISKIPENGRLNTYDFKLSLYDNSWYQWFIRNYKFDSKEKTKVTLECFYGDVIRKTNELMKIKEEQDMLFQFNKQLEKSVKGLEMLRETTYKEDARLTSFFDSLIEDTIRPQIKKISSTLVDEAKPSELSNNNNKKNRKQRVMSE
jgi:hypothetical protein